MTFSLPEMNYLAVLISAVAMMVIGAIWYGPLFGNLWMQGMGWDPNDATAKDKMKQGAGSSYVQMFISALLTSFVLSYFFGTWWSGNNLDQAISGMYYGFLAWLGFALPIIYGKKLWEGKAFKYLAIDLGYYLVSFLVIGIITAFGTASILNEPIDDSSYTKDFSVEEERELKGFVYEKIDKATGGQWDREFSINSTNETNEAAAGSYEAKDWWNWFAWKSGTSTWNVLVDLDGWDCAELDAIPEQYMQFFTDNTYQPSKEILEASGRNCYDHKSRPTEAQSAN